MLISIRWIPEAGEWRAYNADGLLLAQAWRTRKGWRWALVDPDAPTGRARTLAAAKREVAWWLNAVAED